MKVSLNFRLAAFLLWLGFISASPGIAQTNVSCFTPGNSVVTDASGDTILAQHDVQSVHIAEPIFSDGSQVLVFTLKVRNLAPLPLASWNVIFVGQDNVTRFVQMSTLLGNPEFRYGTITNLIGVPIFNYAGNIQGNLNNDGVITFYINKSLVGNLTNGQTIATSARVYIKPVLDLVEVENTPVSNYQIAGNGNCTPYQISQFGANGDVPVSKDYTRNGTADFAVWRPDGGVWFIQDSVTFETSVVQWGNGALGDIAVTGDVDGDGKSDEIIYRPAIGTWFVWQSSTNTYWQMQFGIAEDIPLTGDYDGDRIDDVAVWRPSTGVWYIYRSSSQDVLAVQFGMNEDRPLAGDFDGDRKTDIAVFRPSTGTWYILKSSNGSYIGVGFGLGTDVIVPADYDGDGKTDFAVWRPETSVWYVLRSNDLSVTAYQWGLTIDRVQAGDFNGNGRADYAIWRPTNGVWFVYLN